MGCCNSSPVVPVSGNAAPSTKQAKSTSASIEERLRIEQEEEKRIIKCLLLGTDS